MGRSFVVFVPQTNEAHALSETAALIFELCDGEHTRAEMADALEAAGLPADEAIVDLALNDLAASMLVALDGVQAEAGLTRRIVIRRLGLSAAAAGMLPVVETIFVQPAAAQSSPPPTTSPAPTTTPLPTTTPALTTTPPPTTTPALTTTPPPTTTPAPTTTPPAVTSPNLTSVIIAGR